MTPQEMIEHCRKQQQITGRNDAPCMFLVPGGWGKGRKQLIKAKGAPFGDVVANITPGFCNCFFKANEVILFLEKLIKEAHLDAKDNT